MQHGARLELSPAAKKGAPGRQGRGKQGTAEQRGGAQAPAWLSKLALPDIPVRWDAKVIRFLEFYRSNPRGRAIMSLWLKRKGRYEKLITAALRRHKLPSSLIYLVMTESGFNPHTTSRVGAAGLWQFMPGPGRGFGLQRDYWVDERRNPDLATEAGIQYLKRLHRMLKSWELALAAYNAGFGSVLTAMQKYNTNDYWRLCSYEAGLPWGTTIYVPKIMALAVVGANRDYFGFGQVKPDPELTFDVVAVSTSLTLAQAARAAGSTTEQLVLLNPELRRGRTPPRTKSWIRVPRGSKGRFYTGLARLKGELARYRPYTVRLGDNDNTISRRFGISRRQLRRINKLQSSLELHPGLTILVPARAPRKAPPPRPGKKRGKRGKPGASADPQQHDEPILVALPAGVPKQIEGRRRVFYRTVVGDSLTRIAASLQVKAADLASWNGINPRVKLVSRMVLQAFVANDFARARARLLDPTRLKVMVTGSDEFLDYFERRKGRRRLTILARKGDTLKTVARRMGLTVGDVIRINRISRWSRLKTGQKLVVYVDQRRFRRFMGKGVGKGRGKGNGKGKKGSGARGEGAAIKDSATASSGRGTEIRIKSAIRGESELQDRPGSMRARATTKTERRKKRKSVASARGKGGPKRSQRSTRTPQR